MSLYPEPSRPDTNSIPFGISLLLFEGFDRNWALDREKVDRRRALRNETQSWIFNARFDAWWQIYEIQQHLVSLEETLDRGPETVRVLSRSLLAYKDQILTWQTMGTDDPVSRYRLENQMVLLSALLVQPAHALCFLSNLKDTHEKLAEHVKAEFTDLSDEAFTHTRSLASEWLGPEWQDLPSIPQPCF